MPHFDATITLGSILTALSVLVASVVYWVKLGAIQEAQAVIITELKREFRAHENKDDTRFERLENRIIDLVSGLQRLIGREEVVFRRTPREPEGNR